MTTERKDQKNSPAICRFDFDIRGMDCPDCAMKIEKYISKMNGMDSVNVDFISGKMTALGKDIDEQTIAREVGSLGYQAVSRKSTGSGKEDFGHEARKKELIRIIIAGILTIAGGILLQVSGLSFIGKLSILSGIVISGNEIGRKGLLALRKLNLDMNFLMSTAVLGAVLIGQWLEAGVVIVLFAIAELLESYSLARSNRAVHALLELSPQRAVIRRDGQEISVEIDEIRIGDIVLVRPGETIPVDGVVSTGSSSVNQANITGESIPVPKSPGKDVYAATINGDGYLEIETVKNHEDFKLNKIIRLVEEARSKRAPSQNFVNRFSAIYTPIVTALAVIVAVIPPLVFGAVWVEWIYRALTLLVIACPCALVISTPVTVVSALTNAARNGVLIKGGIFIENLHKMRSAAFDKTGTLTDGVLSVSGIRAFSGANEDNILQLAASLEKKSGHPIAAAIVKSAEERGISFLPVDDFFSIPGKGALGRIDGDRIVVGNEALMREQGFIKEDSGDLGNNLDDGSKTIIMVGTEKDLLGAIMISDSLRPESAPAIEELKPLGVAHSVLITGDNSGSAKKAGNKAGIEEIRAELLPEEKVTAIEDLKKEYGSVAMIGDGVNDAPALASADIGIAMGAIGSDVALETADIALMSDDLLKIPWAFRLSRKAYRIIVANISMAIAIKAIFIGLASTGLATLWMAVFADMGVSLMVIVNGMRALRSR